MKLRNIMIVAAGCVGAALLYRAIQTPDTMPTGAALANVIVPTLSSAATEGGTLFNRSCASCHGTNAVGQNGVAPPLVHIIYEPNHHGDASFYRAAKNGVQAHHWNFGNMPAIEGITDPELEKIVLYVRELQRANGIQ